MAEGVVDVSEAIEVAEEKPHLGLRAGRAGQRMGESVSKQDAVGQTSEWIVGGAPRER